MGGAALILMAPRGLGIRRELVAVAVPGAQSRLGPSPSTGQLVSYAARHAGELLRGMSAQRVVVEDLPAGSAPRADVGWSAVVSDRSGEARERAEAEAVAHGLADWAPESILRYAEWRGLESEWAEIADRFQLAPVGSRLDDADRGAHRDRHRRCGNRAGRTGVRIMPIDVDPGAISRPTGGPRTAAARSSTSRTRRSSGGSS